MTLVLTSLIVMQALLGLLLPGQYRDADWIRATWYGNDWITLLAAVPLLWFGIVLARRGFMRGLLLVPGMGGYAVYNYAFYLFGAALNVFFSLYVLSFLVAYGGAWSGDLARRCRCRRQVFSPSNAGASHWWLLVFVAVGLAIVWLGMWGAYALVGRPTPVEPDAFKVVAALALSLMVPALAVGGVLLWKRRPWGYLIATIAAVQAALYLLVLSVNSAIAIRRGVAAAPGELPIWGPLAVLTTVATAVLLRSASGGRRGLPLASTSEQR